MASSIILTFNSLPALDTSIVISDSLRTGLLMAETFKQNRESSGQTSLGNSISECMLNFRNAFNNDYNIALNYSISIDYENSTITITANNPETDFDELVNSTDGAIIIGRNNQSFTPFSINEVTASEASSNPCNTIRLTVNSNQQATQIQSPITQVVSSNPFVFELERQSSPVFLQMSNENGSSTVSVRIPRLLASYIDVNVNYTAFQATVTVVRNYPLSDIGFGNFFPLTFEYKVDSGSWQSSNVFQGLDDGDYTMHVRDNVGCEITIPFTVDLGSNPNELNDKKVCFISKFNSIAYKKVESFDNCTLNKNSDNTLSYETRDKLPTKDFKQLFQKCDIDTTQISTTYENVSAKIIDCEGNEEPLVVVKKTDNLGKLDVRDAQYYRSLNDNYYVSFDSGYTYNPDTLEQDQSYDTDGELMEWIEVGSFVNVEGYGWYEVLEIYKGAQGLFGSESQYSGKDWIRLSIPNIYNEDIVTVGTVRVTSSFNVFDFERHEFSINFGNKEGKYQILVECTDDRWEDCCFLSEVLYVKESHPNHYYIEAWSTENTSEVNYSFGLRHKLRIPYIYNLKWKPFSKQENYVANNNTFQLQSEVREYYELNARPLPTNIAQKLTLISSLNRIFIGGQAFLREGEVESSPLGQTGKHTFKCELVRKDYKYDSENVITQELPTVIDALAISDASDAGVILVD